MTANEILLESRTFALFRGIVEFLENSASNSKALRAAYVVLEHIYPQRIANRIDKANNRHTSYLSKNIFSPGVIFPLIYLLFISVSSYRVSNIALFTIAFGLLFFYIGIKFSRSDLEEVRLNKDTGKIGLFLFGLGTVFLVADLAAAGAIPLFDPSARSRLIVIYTMLAQLIPPGGILLIAFFGEQYKEQKLELRRARIYAFGVFFASVILISTLGFRTQIIVTLLGSFIAMYFTGLVGFLEVLLSLALAGFGIVSLGFIRANIQGSPIGFFDVIGARVGLTLSVYDYLISRFLPLGVNKGYTLLASFSSFIPGIPGPRLGPRTIVARLFGIFGISITSTILGTVVLDFGILGIAIFMFLLGHVLGTAHMAAKTSSAMGVGIYSVLLAYSLAGIETGIVDFNVLIMFLAGYLLLRSSSRS